MRLRPLSRSRLALALCTDAGTIWVTIDIKAAIGSNLYFDEITQNGAWISQKKVAANSGAGEETTYTYSVRPRSALS